MHYIYIYTTLQYISVCTTAKVSKMICNAIGLWNINKSICLIHILRKYKSLIFICLAFRKF